MLEILANAKRKYWMLKKKTLNFKKWAWKNMK